MIQDYTKSLYVIGRAMTDLEHRFARAGSPQFATTAAREMATITGKAPVATMQDYVSLVIARKLALVK